MIFFGIITVLYFEPEKKEQKKISFWAKSALILLSILIGILFFYLTRAIGWLSIMVGIASAIIYYFIIYINNPEN